MRFVLVIAVILAISACEGDTTYNYPTAPGVCCEDCPSNPPEPCEDCVEDDDDDDD